MNTPVTNGRIMSTAAPTRLLYRFTKTGGDVAEIREQSVTQFRAIEFLVFVNGSLLVGELFHGGREFEYPAAVERRVAQFIDGGWSPVALEAQRVC
jgi:hypothetical protein